MGKFIELTYTGAYKNFNSEEYPTNKILVNISTIKSVAPNGTGSRITFEDEELNCKESYEWVKSQLIIEDNL